MADLLGYAASIAVLATFLMRTMAPLRLVAIVSNVLFLSYGYIEHIYPVFVLHSVLLPINLWRLFVQRNDAGLRRAAAGPVISDYAGSTPYGLWFALGLLIGLMGPLPVILMIGKSEAAKLVLPFAAIPPPSSFHGTDSPLLHKILIADPAE